MARAVLLEPLPYGNPAALVAVFESWPQNPGATTPLSPPNFVDYRAQQRAFTDIAAYAGDGFGHLGAAERRAGGLGARWPSGPTCFRVLQVDALHGRTFSPDADKPGHHLEGRRVI